MWVDNGGRIHEAGVKHSQFLTVTQFLTLFPNQEYKRMEANYYQMEQLKAAYEAGQECVTEVEPPPKPVVTVTATPSNNVLAQINAQRVYNQNLRAGWR